MPKVTGKGVHVDVPLSNVAIAYRPSGFIADMIFPMVTVPKQSDSYYIFDKEDAFRIKDTLRAPATMANIVTRGISTATFFCKNYALRDFIPDEDIKNADAGMVFTERQMRTEVLKDDLYLDWEYRVANLVTSGSNVGSYTTVASGWTDAANCDGLGDVETMLDVAEDLSGYRPNAAVFGRAAWRTWSRSDNVVNKAYGTAGTATSGRLINIEKAKAILELDEVLIGGAYYNSNQEGQSISLSQIWNDNVLLYYKPPAASKERPSFGYSFRWNALGVAMQARVKHDDDRDAEEVKLGYYQDEKITASTLGVLIKGVNSSQ